MIEDNPEFVKESNLPTGTDCGEGQRPPGFTRGCVPTAFQAAVAGLARSPRPNGPAESSPG